SDPSARWRSASVEKRQELVIGRLPRMVVFPSSFRRFPPKSNNEMQHFFFGGKSGETIVLSGKKGPPKRPLSSSLRRQPGRTKNQFAQRTTQIPATSAT